MLGTVAAWLSVNVLPLTPVTVVPSGIPGPAMLKPTNTPVALATLSVVEAVELAEAVVATKGSAAILPALTTAKLAPLATVAQPPKIVPVRASLVLPTMTPPVPIVVATVPKSRPEPALARVIVPRLRVSAATVVPALVVREPPASSVVAKKAWVLVPLVLAVTFKVPPPSSSVLEPLRIVTGAVVRLLKLRLSVPPSTVVLPV